MANLSSNILHVRTRKGGREMGEEGRYHYYHHFAVDKPGTEERK